MKWLLVISLSLAGMMGLSAFGPIQIVKSAAAQSIAVMPGNRGPMTRPAPQMRPMPNVARPTPVRPRPSMTRPNYSRPSVKPRPFPTRPNRPGAGMTRPLFNPNTGQGVRPTIVRPRPIRPLRPQPVRPNPYPQYPDFVDTPQVIDDITPQRPPNWRPPSHRPPHYRPPHYLWGDWLYYGGIGYYHLIRLRGNTIVIVEGLPAGCRKRVRRGGLTLYKCNGVYYRSLHLRGSRVYEVVSKDGAVTAQNGTLRLTKPYMRGPRVLQLQRALSRRGYNVGTPDGIFGRGTARALMSFQRDVGLTPDGVAGRATLRALR